jgi:hypothetical protein
MGLPSMKKNRKLPSWTHAQLDLLEKIAKVLGTDASLSAISMALETAKADVDQVRFALGLTPSTVELDVSGLRMGVEKMREGTQLELAIQSALKAFPFKRARLLVSIAAPEGRYGDYEATLSAQERRDPPRSTMPFTDVIELREKKTVVLDRHVAGSMIAAVSGLVPRDR